MLNDLFERAKSVGFHGTIGLAVILAVIFVAVFGFVYRPDHQLTDDAVQALIMGVGAVIGAAVMMLKGGDRGL